MWGFLQILHDAQLAFLVIRIIQFSTNPTKLCSFFLNLFIWLVTANGDVFQDVLMSQPYDDLTKYFYSI